MKQTLRIMTRDTYESYEDYNFPEEEILMVVDPIERRVCVDLTTRCARATTAINRARRVIAAHEADLDAELIYNVRSFLDEIEEIVKTDAADYRTSTGYMDSYHDHEYPQDNFAVGIDYQDDYIYLWINCSYNNDPIDQPEEPVDISADADTWTARQHDMVNRCYDLAHQCTIPGSIAAARRHDKNAKIATGQVDYYTYQAYAVIDITAQYMSRYGMTAGSTRMMLMMTAQTMSLLRSAAYRMHDAVEAFEASLPMVVGDDA